MAQSLEELISIFIDEDDLNSESRAKAPTQGSVKSYVDNCLITVSGIVIESVVHQEVVYDAFIVASYEEDYPIDQNTGNNSAARYAPFLWNNWDTSYSDCKVRLFTNGNGMDFNGPIFTGEKFATRADLYTWINSVIPNDGSVTSGYARLEVYDEISNVPQLQKIYGYNNLFNAFCGSRNSRKSSTKTAIAGDDYLYDIFEDLTTHFNNEGDLSNTVTSVAIQAEALDNKRLFWIPTTKRNLFGLPQIGQPIRLSSQVPVDKRKWWNDTTGVSRDQNTGSDEDAHPTAALCYVTYNNSSDTWVVRGRNEFFLAREDNLGKSNTSTVVVYLVKHSSSNGDYAFFVKPLGIDRVLVDWFDTNKYQVEVVATNSDRQPRIKPVPLANDVSMGRDAVGDRTTLKRSDWMFDDGLNIMRTVMSVKPRSYKFRLRRLSDNKIGPLTSATIVPVMKTTAAKIKWIVK